MIMRSLKTPCVFSVTIKVPLIYPRILFNIQSQSISKFDTISFETWWKRKFYGWSLSTPKIKRLIFSLNLLMVHGLNLFIGPSVSVSSLDSYLLCDPLLVYLWASLLYRSHMCVFVSFTSFCLFTLFLLILLYYFFFSVLKNSKTHKNEKSQKV